MFNPVSLPKYALMSLLILALLLAGSFSAVAVELMATSQASLSLQSAQSRYAAGDAQGAMSLLRQHILEHPDSPNLAEAYVLLARILLQEQRYADAQMYLQRIDPSQQTNLSQLLMVTALQYGQPADIDSMMRAAKLLAGLHIEQFTGSDRQLFYQNRALALAAQQQPLQALVVLHQALIADEAYDKSAIFKQINMLLNNISAAELGEAEFMFSGTELNDAIVLHRAEQAWRGGDQIGYHDVFHHHQIFDVNGEHHFPDIIG